MGKQELTAKTDWECVPCNWFMFASALEIQREWGIQGDIPRCPECKRTLTPCRIGEK